MTEPGQLWVMMSGNACSCGDRTWRKWISRPSISVMNRGSAFSRVSNLRKSESAPQWRTSSCIVANCTPWV